VLKFKKNTSGAKRLINFLGRYENERWRGSCPVVGFVISSV